MTEPIKEGTMSKTINLPNGEAQEGDRVLLVDDYSAVNGCRFEGTLILDKYDEPIMELDNGERIQFDKEHLVLMASCRDALVELYDVKRRISPFHPGHLAAVGVIEELEGRLQEVIKDPGNSKARKNHG